MSLGVINKNRENLCWNQIGIRCESANVVDFKHRIDIDKQSPSEDSYPARIVSLMETLIELAKLNELRIAGEKIESLLVIILKSLCDYKIRALSIKRITSSAKIIKASSN